MVRRTARYIAAGPRSPADRWPLLQRVRWRFVLLNLIAVVLAPINLPRLIQEPSAHLAGYGAAMAAFGVWTITLYVTAGRRWWMDPMGPMLVGAIGLSAGHHAWAFGSMYMALFLHSLYGERRRTLRNALSYLIAYEAAVWTTVGRSEVFGDQLVSNGLAVLIMSWVMAELATSLRRSDDARRRDDTLTSAGRQLLRAGQPDQVAQVALDGAVSLATESGAAPRRVTVWRETDGQLALAASFGPPPASTRIDLSLMPIPPTSGYRRAEPVRLPPAAMCEVQRATGEAVDPCHGLAVPMTDGDAPTGLVFVETARPLDDDAVAILRRFADEVSLAERAVRRNQLFAGVVNNSPDGIVLVDDRCRVVFASPAVTELVGREVGTREDLGGLLTVGPDAQPLADLAELEEHSAALAVRRANGDLLEVEVSMRVIAGEGTVLNLRDVSQQRRLQEEIAYRAHYDPTTGLPNRALFLDRLDRGLAQARRRGTATIAVALLDIDDFKAINDTFGHLTGDRVLEHVAEQARAVVRDTDTLARLGGDEFALLLQDVTPEVDPERILADVLAAVRRPITLEGHRISVTASCGIVSSTGEHSAEEMLGDADIAMYAAKHGGKDSAVLYGPSLRASADERRQLLNDLELGIDRGELRVYYQPVMSLSGGGAIGVEALVRWQHPAHGLLTPDRFVPLAEESGLISALGHAVLVTACRDLANWVARGCVDDAFQLHVNLSAHQLTEAGLAASVESILLRSGLRPGQLVLEITETALARNPELAEEMLRDIHDLGIGVAIDDFGTGYASFTYLQRFPVDIVKIDRSFIRDVAEGPEEAALACAIVRLAHGLGMATVAEGVESAAAEGLLAEWGCDHAQGWLWSPALPADELLSWLDAPLRVASA
jgi:diguanylate cyclase (GGDEF)-like protein/PAS domain S-box-containing protein